MQSWTTLYKGYPLFHLFPLRLFNLPGTFSALLAPLPFTLSSFQIAVLPATDYACRRKSTIYEDYLRETPPKIKQPPPHPPPPADKFSTSVKLIISSTYRKYLKLWMVPIAKQKKKKKLKSTSRQRDWNGGQSRGGGGWKTVVLRRVLHLTVYLAPHLVPHNPRVLELAKILARVFICEKYSTNTRTHICTSITTSPIFNLPENLFQLVLVRGWGRRVRCFRLGNLADVPPFWWYFLGERLAASAKLPVDRYVSVRRRNLRCE